MSSQVETLLKQVIERLLAAERRLDLLEKSLPDLPPSVSVKGYREDAEGNAYYDDTPLTSGLVGDYREKAPDFRTTTRLAKTLGVSRRVVEYLNSLTEAELDRLAG